MNPNSSAVTQNLKSITRIATTETTGPTGNILLPYDNDGTTFVVAPFVYGTTAFCRVWVAPGNNKWYITVINPNTGETINNTSVSLRYLVVKLYSAT